MDLFSYVEDIKTFLQENRKKTIIVCSLLIFMTFSALIVLAFNYDKKSKKEPPKQIKKLVLDQKLLVPDGPAIPRGYIKARTTQKKWSDEEVEEWFTLPDEEEVKKLEKANNKIVQDIIGAAP